MITLNPYCDKYAIENQLGINQYHKNLLKDQKECHTLYFIYHHKYWQLYQCRSQKLMTHKFTNAQILIKLINVNHENWWNTNSRNHQWKSRNHEKGEAYHKTGVWKLTNTCITKRNAIPWLLTINFWTEAPQKRPEDLWAEAPQKRGLVSLADKETSHIASLNHKNDHHWSSRSVNYTKLVNIWV